MIDFSKPVETRNGLKARILCTDFKGIYPIVASVEKGNFEEIYTYRLDGTHGTSNSFLDLINVPEKINISGWVNVRSNRDPCSFFLGNLYPSRASALECRGDNAIATKYISFSVIVGEGIEDATR